MKDYWNIRIPKPNLSNIRNAIKRVKEFVVKYKRFIYPIGYILCMLPVPMITDGKIGIYVMGVIVGFFATIFYLALKGDNVI